MSIIPPTLKASEVIVQIQKLIDEFGDLECYHECEDCHRGISFIYYRCDEEIIFDKPKFMLGDTSE